MFHFRRPFKNLIRPTIRQVCYPIPHTISPFTYLHLCAHYIFYPPSTFSLLSVSARWHHLERLFEGRCEHTWISKYASRIITCPSYLSNFSPLFSEPSSNHSSLQLATSASFPYLRCSFFLLVPSLTFSENASSPPPPFHGTYSNLSILPAYSCTYQTYKGIAVKKSTPDLRGAALNPRQCRIRTLSMHLNQIVHVVRSTRAPATSEQLLSNFWGQGACDTDKHK